MKPGQKPGDMASALESSFFMTTKLGNVRYQGCSDSGQQRLQQLGYTQELQRKFGVLTSAASAFAVNSYMMSLTGTLPSAITYGGPLPAVYGWLIVAFFNGFVILSMAELASSYPLAGGPYFWCVELTRNDPKYTFVAWCTGWLNVLGQFAATAGAGFFAAEHVAAMWLLANGYVFKQRDLFLAYAICLLIAGLLSSLSTESTQKVILFSAGFLILGGLFLFIYLPVLAEQHSSTHWVFTNFIMEGKEQNGLPDYSYLFFMGFLLSQFSFIGGEAPSQFAEETKHADRVAPLGFLIGYAMTTVMGFGYVVVLFYCMQQADTNELMNGEAGGYVVGQIFWDLFKARYGDGTGGVILLGIPLIAIFSTVVMCMLTNARMLWSSRDGGVWLYRVWASVNGRTGTPVNAVWAMTALAFLLGMPMLWSTTAFLAIGSISSVGLFISYAVPIFLRLVMANNFEPGPFKIWRLARPFINIIAILWIIFVVVLCVIPTQFPVNAGNMNWTPVPVVAVLLLCLAAWFLPVIGARHWYHGKAHTLAADTNVRGGGRYGLDGRADYGRPDAHARLTLHDLANLPKTVLGLGGPPRGFDLEITLQPRALRGTNIDGTAQLLAGHSAGPPTMPRSPPNSFLMARLPRITDTEERSTRPPRTSEV